MPRKDLTPEEEKTWHWWSNTVHRKVFSEALQGKTIAEISKALKISEVRAVGIYRNPRFLDRLQDYLFICEIRKALIQAHHLEKMWKDIDSQLKQVKPEAYLKEFHRLLLDKEFKKTLNLSFVKIIREKRAAAKKAEAEQEEKSRKYFGVTELHVTDEERKQIQQVDNGLDSGLEDQDEQKSAD